MITNTSEHRYVTEKIYSRLPPFEILNFNPKSASMPPGLCEAVRIMPPFVLYFLITYDKAGVEKTPF